MNWIPTCFFCPNPLGIVLAATHECAGVGVIRYISLPTSGVATCCHAANAPAVASLRQEPRIIPS